MKLNKFFALYQLAFGIMGVINTSIFVVNNNYFNAEFNIAIFIIFALLLFVLSIVSGIELFRENIKRGKALFYLTMLFQLFVFQTKSGWIYEFYNGLYFTINFIGDFSLDFGVLSVMKFYVSYFIKSFSFGINLIPIILTYIFHKDVSKVC